MTYNKLTRPQRKALKIWRKNMKREGYSLQEIDNAIQSGEAAHILAAVEIADDETDGEYVHTAVDDFFRKREKETNSALTSGQQYRATCKSGYKAWCNHSGAATLFKIGASEICGASRYDCRNIAPSCALIVDLTGMADRVLNTPAGYESLQAHTAGAVPMISLDWPDHGIPPIALSFWPELVRLLPPGKVMFRCMGGHGRTGTALAALLICAHDMTARDAIAFVRKAHCHDSVETNGQREYLASLARYCGRPDDPVPLLTMTTPTPAATIAAREHSPLASVHDDAEGYDCPKCAYSCAHAVNMAEHRQHAHGD